MKDTITVTLVGPTDCPLCAEVKETVEALKSKYPLSVQQIDAYSPEGEELVLEHGILASPGVLINGTFIGAGNLSSWKLENYIQKLAD